MPVRHPILERLDRLGLGEAAAKMIDASVDTIVKEQGENSCEELLEHIKQFVAADVKITKNELNIRNYEV